MLTKKLCKDSARSVQDKTKVCFCFYCRAAAYLSLLMFRIQPALVKSKTSVNELPVRRGKGCVYYKRRKKKCVNAKLMCAFARFLPLTLNFRFAFDEVLHKEVLPIENSVGELRNPIA